MQEFIFRIEQNYKKLRSLELQLGENFLGDNGEYLKLLGDGIKQLPSLENLELNIPGNDLGVNEIQNIQRLFLRSILQIEEIN